MPENLHFYPPLSPLLQRAFTNLPKIVSPYKLSLSNKGPKKHCKLPKGSSLLSENRKKKIRLSFYEICPESIQPFTMKTGDIY